MKLLYFKNFLRESDENEEDKGIKINAKVAGLSYELFAEDELNEHIIRAILEKIDSEVTKKEVLEGPFKEDGKIDYKKANEYMFEIMINKLTTLTRKQLRAKELEKRSKLDERYAMPAVGGATPDLLMDIMPRQSKSPTLHFMNFAYYGKVTYKKEIADLINVYYKYYKGKVNKKSIILNMLFDIEKDQS